MARTLSELTTNLLPTPYEPVGISDHQPMERIFNLMLKRTRRIVGET